MNQDIDPGLQWGTDVLASQAFSALVGAQLTVLCHGRAEVCIPISDKLRQQHGFVHGGVVSYAADNALAFAGGSIFGPAVVTSEFKINYVRPALGDRLAARAIVLHAGKNFAICRCDVFAVNGAKEKLCAVAQGTIARLGGEDRGERLAGINSEP